ncbi:MAG TPA: PAS domain S-box protein, partial [Steroidobacteraceae bacterium]|nr:PAS domain S-box protein [Steroidobacteraceae bacterium]
MSAFAEVVYRMSPDWSEMRCLEGGNFVSDTREPSRTWLDKYIYPDDQAQVTAAIAAAIRSKGVFALEHRVRRANGSVGWAFSRAAPLLDEQGNITEWFGAATDVTARRQAEARYRVIFDDAPIGIAHVALDGRWLRFNQAVCAITGRSREQLERLTFADITHPEDLETDWSNVRRLVAGEITSYSMEKRYLRPDQSVVWANLTVSLLRDPAGLPEHFIAIVEDITGRKQTQERLRESEERLRNLVRQSSVGIAEADAAGRLRFVNDRYCALLGYTREELVGRNVRDVTHPDD